MGSGSIQGMVTDPSGAVVSNATVTAIDADTGQTVTARTSSAAATDHNRADPSENRSSGRYPASRAPAQPRQAVTHPRRATHKKVHPGRFEGGQFYFD